MQSRCRDAHACHKQTRDMQRHSTSHSQPHAQAQEHAAAPIAAAGCSHHFPASKARAESPGSQQTCRANETHAARCKTAQTPLPEHTHASQHHSRSQHGHSRGTEQKEAHLGFSRRRSSADFDEVCRFPRIHAVFQTEFTRRSAWSKVGGATCRSGSQRDSRATLLHTHTP